MAAPLAAFIRLSAMLPLASTTKTMSEPALRAIFLERTSLCSIKTGLSTAARPRRPRWYGAAARIVASTASRRTLPCARERGEGKGAGREMAGRRLAVAHASRSCGRGGVGSVGSKIEKRRPPSGASA